MRGLVVLKIMYVLVGLVMFSTLAITNIQAAVPETSYADLHWRQVGPFRGGWATAVAGHPDKITTFTLDQPMAGCGKQTMPV